MPEEKNNNQVYVTVKRKDGTVERVLLSDLQNNTKPQNHKTTEPRTERGESKVESPKSKAESKAAPQQSTPPARGGGSHASGSKIQETKQQNNKTTKQQNGDAKQVGVTKNDAPKDASSGNGGVARDLSEKKKNTTNDERQSSNPKPHLTSPSKGEEPQAASKKSEPKAESGKPKAENKQDSGGADVGTARELSNTATEKENTRPTPSAKEEKTQANTHKQKDANTSATHKALATETPHELTNTAPVRDIFEDMAASHAWDTQDHSSLLEEIIERHEADAQAKKTAPKRDAQVQAVLEKIDVPVEERLIPRLKSLIESRLKSVRNDRQLREYAMRSQEKNGLGLDETHADSLVAAIQSVYHVAPLEDKVAAPKTKKTSDADRLQQQANARVHAAQTHEQPSHGVKVREQAKKKPVMHDVTPPTQDTSRAVSPVDELGQLTRTEFRRLGNDAAQARRRLAQKIDALQEESYVRYLDAIDAWFRSPLYRELHEVLAATLKSEQSLAQVLQQDQDALNLDEIKELAALSASLSK